jgi:MFS family permease
MAPEDPPAAATEPARRLAEAPTEAPFPPPEPWAKRTFAAFSSPNYRLFFLGQGVSMVGSWARSTAQGWLVYDLTGDKRKLAWVSAASLLPLALLALPAGAVIDRVDKRRLLLWTQVVQMALSAALATLVATGAVRWEHVLAIATGMGIAVAFEMPCRQAFVVEMVGKENLRNAVALNSILFNLALILGPAIAAGLMATVGIWACFAFDALSFVAIIAGFAWMVLPPHAPRPRTEHGWAHLTAGVRYVARDLRVRTLMTLLAIAMVFGWSYSSLLPAYARDVLREGETGYAWLFASSGVGACVGALWVAGRHGGRPHWVVFGTLWLFSASLLGFASTTWLAPAMALRALAGLSMIAFFATCNYAIQVSVPDALRGRVMALWALVFGASLPLGNVLMGEVAQRLGTSHAIGGGAAACLLASLAIAAARPFRERRASTRGPGQRSRETT